MRFRQVFFGLALAASPALAGADPALPIGRTPLASASLGGERRVSQAPVMRLDFAPGQGSGRHVHPMPVVGYVLEGDFVVQAAGGAAEHYRAGEIIQEPADTVIERFDNDSATRPAVFIAFYLAAAGQTELIRPAGPR